MSAWARALAGIVLGVAAIPVLADDDLTRMDVYEAQNALGTMEYRVFAPENLDGAVPLFVHVHGGNISVVDVAHQSRLNELAAQRGFVVVYPQEDPSKNLGIWDHTRAASDGREGRATSLIAQITWEVIDRYPIDPQRVFIGGISAGSGIAIVMGAQYPELYAGVQAEGGDRYGEAWVGQAQAGRLVYEAMGERARRVPMILSIGTLDPFGLTTNTDSVVRHWLIAHDWIDDGEANGSVSLQPATTRTGRDGKAYSVDSYVDAQGCVLVERWLIQGLFHAYSGGARATFFDITSDPNAPHMREVAYDFFLDQYDADGPPGCTVAAPTSGGGGGMFHLVVLFLLLSLRTIVSTRHPVRRPRRA